MKGKQITKMTVKFSCKIFETFVTKIHQKFSVATVTSGCTLNAI